MDPPVRVIKANQYIDCTGEGVVAHSAGYSTMKGRPEDGLQLPMSFKLYVDEVENGSGIAVPAGWIDVIAGEDDLPMTSPNKTLYQRRRAVKIKIPMYDSTNTESLTDAEIGARRRAVQVVDYFNRVRGENWRISRCSPRTNGMYLPIKFRSGLSSQKTAAAYLWPDAACRRISSPFLPRESQPHVQ